MKSHSYPTIAFFSLCALGSALAGANGLDLTTGEARVAGENSLSLENLSLDDRFYNAVIRLNLDGTYNVLGAEEVVIPATASYEMSFDSTWSAVTHPHEYPSGLSHFSGLIGGTHNANIRFWKRSEIASSGMELMAELGSKSSLRN